MILIMILIMIACGDRHYADPGACALQIEYVGKFHNIRELYFWTDEACRVFQYKFDLNSSELLSEYDNIIVSSVSKNEQQEFCSFDPAAQACVYEDGRVYIRSSSRGREVLRHEILHLLMWKARFGDGNAHHNIMREYDWY